MVVAAYLREYKLSPQCVLVFKNKVHKVQVSEKYVQTTRWKKKQNYKQQTPTFLSAISACIMFHAKTSQTHDTPTKLRY